VNHQVLGDAADVVLGFAFPSRLFSYEESDHPRVLRGDNIGQGRLSWDPGHAARWPELAPKGTELRLGDVVLAMDRPWVGAGLKFASVTNSDLPLLLGQRVAALRARDGSHQRFLHYVLSTRGFMQYVLGAQTGTGVPHLSAEQIRKFPIVIPPLEDQRAIAEVLGALDDKITANAATSKTLVELESALTKYEIQEGEVCRLGELATITMGSSPKGASYNQNGEGLPLYQGTRDFGVRWPTPRVWTTAPVRVAKAGDILMSVRAPVGSLNRAIDGCSIGRGLAALTSATPTAVHNLLLVQPELFAPFNNEGTIFGSIAKGQLHGINLRVPQSGLLRLECKLSSYEELLTQLIRESQTLAELRDTLLPALMDGTIRVKDAVAAAEEVL